MIFIYFILIFFLFFFSFFFFTTYNSIFKFLLIFLFFFSLYIYFFLSYLPFLVYPLYDIRDFMEFNPLNNFFSKNFFFESRRLFFSLDSDIIHEFPFFFNFDFELDFLNISLILLSTFLIIICIIISWNYILVYLGEYLSLFIFLNFILITFFSTIDLFFFFFLFEITLLPMYLIISIWGSRKRKIHASYVFFFFTLFGSFLMFLTIAQLFAIFKTSDFFILHLLLNHLEMLNYFLFEFNYNIIGYVSPKIDLFLLKYFWISFFIGFCVKIPIYPFHIWLPEAHVEANTAGSVILAGILLKMGVYGLFRILLFFFPALSIFFSPILFTLCLIGILYTSLITLFQIDIKKIIAYSSVSHMGYCVLGLSVISITASSGSFFIMLSHGLISSLLFILIGLLYERLGTRLISHISGISNLLPQFSFFFFLALLSNMSFPITSGFIGELLVLLGVIHYSFFSTFLAGIGTIFCGIYSIWLITRLCFGSSIFSLNENLFFFDLTFREFLVVFFFIFLIFGFGSFPNIILNPFFEFGLRIRY
jgi:NADH-quinone oxidoreductase subunit M